MTWWSRIYDVNEWNLNGAFCLVITKKQTKQSFAFFSFRDVSSIRWVIVSASPSSSTFFFLTGPKRDYWATDRRKKDSRVLRACDKIVNSAGFQSAFLSATSFQHFATSPPAARLLQQRKCNQIQSTWSYSSIRVFKYYDKSPCAWCRLRWFPCWTNCFATVFQLCRTARSSTTVFMDLLLVWYLAITTCAIINIMTTLFFVILIVSRLHAFFVVVPVRSSLHVIVVVAVISYFQQLVGGPQKTISSNLLMNVVSACRASVACISHHDTLLGAARKRPASRWTLVVHRWTS